MEMRIEHGDQEDATKANEDGVDSKEEKVALTPDDMNGSEAFFALMAIKIMKLANKYNRKLDDIHSLFFMVSCDFQLLEQTLEA